MTGTGKGKNYPRIHSKITDDVPLSKGMKSKEISGQLNFVCGEGRKLGVTAIRLESEFIRNVKAQPVAMNEAISLFFDHKKHCKYCHANKEARIDALREYKPQAGPRKLDFRRKYIKKK